MRVFWQYERLEPRFESTTDLAGEASTLLALSDVAWLGALLVSDGVFGLGRTRWFVLCCAEQIVQQISGAHSMYSCLLIHESSHTPPFLSQSHAGTCVKGVTRVIKHR